MLQLDIVYADGTHSHAWGGVDSIEDAIDRAATKGKAIVAWALYDA